MITPQKPNLRSHLLVVVDNLSSEQLIELGNKIKKLSVPPIVTLVKSFPFHNMHQVEEAQARQVLAKARQDFNFHASTETLFGSNPKNITDLFARGIFDVMIGADRNKQLFAMTKTKNPEEETASIKELFEKIPVTYLPPFQPSPSIASQSSISTASYKPVFAPASKRPVTPVVEEKVPIIPVPTLMKQR